MRFKSKIFCKMIDLSGIYQSLSTLENVKYIEEHKRHNSSLKLKLINLKLSTKTKISGLTDNFSKLEFLRSRNQKLKKTLLIK